MLAAGTQLLRHNIPRSERKRWPAPIHLSVQKVAGSLPPACDMRKPERNVLPLTDVSDFTAPVGIPGARIYFVAPFLAARDTPADAVELSLKVGHKTFKHPEIICISQNARDSPQMVKSIEVPFLLYGRPEPDIRISRAQSGGR